MRHTHYKYLVAGAGPAGINVVAKLLESGINPETILWVDPTFLAGDFGTKWRDVPGNTKVSAYLPWFEMLKIVIEQTRTSADCSMLEAYSESLSIFKSLPAEYTCPLKDAAAPMYLATQYFKTVADIKVSSVTHLKKCDTDWEVSFADKALCHTQSVIIATGAEAKKAVLPIGCAYAEIPLEMASQEIKSQQFYREGKSIAVIGSSHSAALSVMQLLKSDHSVIWFKRDSANACRYAEFHADYTLYDNTGLKGEVALYMKRLEAHHHPKLTVVESNQENLSIYLKSCSHVIHAVGFVPRSLTIEAYEAKLSSSDIDYDPQTGFADSKYPGLFFHGIVRPTIADELASRGPVHADGTREVLMASAIGVGKFHKAFTAETIHQLERHCVV